MSTRVPLRWYSLTEAASHLGCTAYALRKACMRGQRRRLGGVEADVKGARARKFGGKWLVALGERWKGIPRQYYRLKDAAEILGASVDALRRRVERACQSGDVQIDGVAAFKRGGQWLISFGNGWC